MTARRTVGRGLPDAQRITPGRYVVKVGCPSCGVEEDLGLSMYPVLTAKPGVQVISLDVMTASSTHHCEGERS